MNTITPACFGTFNRNDNLCIYCTLNEECARLKNKPKTPPQMPDDYNFEIGM